MRALALAAPLIALATGAIAQNSAETALIKHVFAQLQPISIRENVEYCGYIGFDAAGDLVASDAVRGEEGSCEPDDPARIEVIVASYHTHGAFSEDFYNEVPSIDDVEGDEDEGIDGYVATPGGRLWFIETEDMTISQLCGLGCLMQDPDFVRGSDGLIAESYNYDELVEKLDE